MVEGVGKRPPPKIAVHIDSGEISLASHLATERLKYRGYAESTDSWKQSKIGAHFAIQVGYVCEFAFRRWIWDELGIWLDIDTQPRVNGDGGIDFRVAGYGVQVKGANSPYDNLLIRTCDAAGPPESPTAWDVCVRAHWPARSGDEPSGGLFDAGKLTDDERVELTGWVWGRDLHRISHIEPGRFSDHHNYVVTPGDFNGMTAFADIVRARLTRRDRDDNK